MPRTPFGEMSCSVARTLEVVGERWTLLIVRDLLFGITRFEAIQRDLGISRKVLAERLATLAEQGIVDRAPYQEHPPRHDYVLSRKGVELAGVLLAMKAWGDRWACPDAGPPLVLRHDRCGAVTEVVPACSHCGDPLRPSEVTAMLGPGAAPGPGTSELYAAMAGRQD